MAVRKIKNSYWVDFRFEHNRYRKRSPESSKKGAEAYEAVLRRKLANGESIDTPEKGSDKLQLFKEFANNWFDTYVKTNNKPSEIINKRYILRNSLIPFFGNTPISKISSLQIEKFKVWKKDDRLENKTVNNHLTVLSKCLHTAQDWDLLDKLPKIKKLKTPPPHDNFLNEEECQMLLGQLDGVWADIVLTALKTGLRVGELRGLQWKDINWNQQTMTVNNAWCDRSKQLLAPKSNRSRCIPLGKEVYSMLYRKQRASGFVFATEGDGYFGDDRLNRKITKACKEAGIKRVTCHILRHTFASHLAMAGAPLGAIQSLLGHSTIQTTMRYAHLSKSALKDAVDLLEPKPTIENYGQPVGNPQVFKLKDPEGIRVF